MVTEKRRTHREQLAFRIEPLQGFVQTPNVQAPVQMPVSVIVRQNSPIYGNTVGVTVADEYHMALYSAVAQADSEIEQERGQREALERTYPFLAAGYRFEQALRERTYGGTEQIWQLLDPWGRVHRHNCPVLRYAPEPWKATPVVPEKTPFAEPPEPKGDEAAGGSGERLVGEGR